MTKPVTISLAPGKQMAHRILVTVPALAGWNRAGGLCGALTYQRIFASDFLVALPGGKDDGAWMKLLRLLGLHPQRACLFSRAGLSERAAGGDAELVELVAMLQPWLTCAVAPAKTSEACQRLREEIAVLGARCGRMLQLAIEPDAHEEPDLSCGELLQRLQDPGWVQDRLAAAALARGQGDRLARRVLAFARSVPGKNSSQDEAVAAFCAEARIAQAADDENDRQLLAAGNRRVVALARVNRCLPAMARIEAI